MECSVKDFILTAYLEDISICDQIIQYHKISNDKFSGEIFINNEPTIDTNIKISTDVTFNFNSMLWKNYVQQLHNVVNKYLEIYDWAEKTPRWEIREKVNIQHYKQNEGFKSWHFERASNKNPVVYRHLVFMTYLNDVNDQGETEFLYQAYKVKPKKGLTLIWPADWTHVHRGISSPTEEKYIVTGWFSYEKGE